MKTASSSASSTATANRSDRVSSRTGLAADAIATGLIDNLRYLQARLPKHATRHDWYMALAFTVRDRMMDRYIATLERMSGADTAARMVAYPPRREKRRRGDTGKG